MGEEKFASLSSGLLARKGAAKPAMRRQNFMNPQGDVPSSDIHEDLGWNDMGHDIPHAIDPENLEAHGEAQVPEVRKQLDQLSEGFGEDGEPSQFTVADLESELTDDYDDRPTITTNSHGGLTPMGADDEEYEEDPEDETAEMDTPAAGVWGSSPPLPPDDMSDFGEPEEADDYDGPTGFEPIAARDSSEDEDAYEDEASYEEETFEADEEAEPAFEDEREPEPLAAADASDTDDWSEPEDSFEDEEPAEPPVPPSIPKPLSRPMIVPRITLGEDNVPAREKIAFTLRLDKERHLKLRLASAVTNRSAQRLVTAALDQFLESIPEVEALAEKSAGRKTH